MLSLKLPFTLQLFLEHSIWIQRWILVNLIIRSSSNKMSFGSWWYLSSSSIFKFEKVLKKLANHCGSTDYDDDDYDDDSFQQLPHEFKPKPHSLKIGMFAHTFMGNGETGVWAIPMALFAPLLHMTFENRFEHHLVVDHGFMMDWCSRDFSCGPLQSDISCPCGSWNQCPWFWHWQITIVTSFLSAVLFIEVTIKRTH